MQATLAICSSPDTTGSRDSSQTLKILLTDIRAHMMSDTLVEVRIIAESEFQERGDDVEATLRRGEVRWRAAACASRADRSAPGIGRHYLACYLNFNLFID